jgi:hypothetical protein
VGLHWIDNLNFICNTKLLANFLHLKPNSVCADFRSYGIRSLPKHYVHRGFLDRLPDPRGWKLHDCPGLLSREGILSGFQFPVSRCHTPPPASTLSLPAPCKEAPCEECSDSGQCFPKLEEDRPLQGHELGIVRPLFPNWS